MIGYDEICRGTGVEPEWNLSETSEGARVRRGPRSPQLKKSRAWLSAGGADHQLVAIVSGGLDNQRAVVGGGRKEAKQLASFWVILCMAAP